MSPDIEKKIGELTRILQAKLKGMTVILFGSTARGDHAEESDIDLCVICQPDQRKSVSKVILAAQKHLSVDIQLVFTDPDLGGLDHTFLGTILREGRVLVGQWPVIAVQRLRLEPYRLFRYDLRGLTAAQKMRIKRALYGTVTKKSYKGKVYVSMQSGLIDERSAIRAGIASVLVPEKDARKVLDLLRSSGAQVRDIPMWLPAV